MEELAPKKALLERIKASEGSGFEYDEQAILEAYHLEKENKSSIAIKILSILGGFIAMLTFLGFLFIAGLYDSELGLILFGVGFIGTAIALNTQYDKLITDTFSISLYIIGFMLFAIGLAFMEVDENTIIFLVCAIALSALFITQNYILSFISVLIFFGSLLSLIIFNHLFYLVHLYTALTTLALIYVFLNEAKIISAHPKLSKLYNPLRIGLVIAFIFGLAALGKNDYIAIRQDHLWWSSIIMILCFLYLVHIIIKVNAITAVKTKIGVYVLSGLIALSTWFSPAISGALIVILLSFYVNYKTGFIIGIIALIYFISQFYYDLSFTLLTKSILLFTSGVVFLLLYLFTTKKTPTNEKI